MLAPFLTEGHEGFNIDDEEDFARAEELVAAGRASLVARRARAVSCATVKLASLETLACDAGWRPWLFVKATTDDGLVGWSEVTDSHGSPHRPRRASSRTSRRSSSAATRAPSRRSTGISTAARGRAPARSSQKAIGGDRERAARPEGQGARRVRSRELFGGPTRETIPLYWSHCGTTRARAWEVTGTPKLDSYDAVAALGREVVERGYRAFKTNIVVPGDEPRGADARLRPRRRHRPQPDARAARDASTRLLEAFREGTGGKAQPIVDLNFNLDDRGDRPRRPRARAVRPRSGSRSTRSTRPRWRSCAPSLADPALLGREPLHAYGASGRTSRRARMDVASVDVIWNGSRQSLKIAALAETLRGRLRAAQLLQPSRDVHRCAVVRRDPERAAARDRRGRRPVARGARRPRCRRSATASSSCPPGRAGAATSPGRPRRLIRCRSFEAPHDRAREPLLPQPELQSRELPELVRRPRRLRILSCS